MARMHMVCSLLIEFFLRQKKKFLKTEIYNCIYIKNEGLINV